MRSSAGTRAAVDDMYGRCWGERACVKSEDREMKTTVKACCNDQRTNSRVDRLQLNHVRGNVLTMIYEQYLPHVLALFHELVRDNFTGSLLNIGIMSEEFSLWSQICTKYISFDVFRHDNRLKSLLHGHTIYAFTEP